MRVWPRLALCSSSATREFTGSPTGAAEACMGPASPSHRSDARARREDSRKVRTYVR